MCFKDAYNISENFGDMVNSIISLKNITDVYYMLGNFKEAEKWQKKTQKMENILRKRRLI